MDFELFLQWAEPILAVITLILLAISQAFREKKNMKEWLLLAVTEAEKALGKGTGVLKLRHVYESFVNTFPVMSRLVSFDTYHQWVKDALEDMNHLIDTNGHIKDYVKGESEDC